MVLSGQQDIVDSPAFLGMHHSGHNAGGNAPLPAQARPKSLPGESCGDDADHVEIGHADIFKCGAAQPTPKMFRRPVKKGRCDLQCELVPPAPDRLLHEAHGDPRRNGQRTARRWLEFSYGLQQLASGSAEYTSSLSMKAFPRLW